MAKMLCIPEGIFTVYSEEYDKIQQDSIKVVFSEDGLTLIVYQYCKNKIIILDNPVV